MGQVDACCSSPDRSQPNAPSIKSALTIYGDWFNQDTRALIAICNMAEVPCEFVHVDTFNQENMRDPYVQLNPNSTIPMITEGMAKIIGDGASLYYFLVNRHARIK